MTRDQKTFLEGHLRKATLEQPEHKHLKSLLLKFGGGLIVAPLKQDPDVPRLLQWVPDERTDSLQAKESPHVSSKCICHLGKRAEGPCWRRDLRWIKRGWSVAATLLGSHTRWRAREYGEAPEVFRDIAARSAADHFASYNVT
jgi:hypothetical protein